jgi:excinuclease ABC subunit A
MGPEGGHRGGEVVTVGVPDTVAGVNASYTGQYLRRMLKPVHPAGARRRI